VSAEIEELEKRSWAQTAINSFRSQLSHERKSPVSGSPSAARLHLRALSRCDAKSYVFAGAAGQRCMAISVAVFVGESAQLLGAVKAKAAALKVGLRVWRGLGSYRSHRLSCTRRVCAGSIRNESIGLGLGRRLRLGLGLRAGPLAFNLDASFTHADGGGGKAPYLVGWTRDTWR